MTLIAKISSEDHAKLEPSLQKEYVQRDGAYFVDVRPVTEKDADGNEKTWALEDVAGLKRTLNDARRKRDDAIAYGKAFGEGITPEKVAELRDELDRLKSVDPNSKTAEIRKQVEDALAKKYEKTIGEKDGLISSLDGELDYLVVTGSARAALAKHVKTPEGVELMLPHVLARMKSKKGPDGRRIAVVKSRDGGEEPTKRGTSMEPMLADELVELMKLESTYAPAFPGSGITGSGASSSNGTGGPKSNVDPELPPTERMKNFRAQRAGKAG